ncbi:hypothetical protein ACDX77_18905 [Bacillus velezensis]|uniref:hypothetical protein n=1 Tax=Bacillus velezensis TaxID=492670 RepID=UPI0035573063
MQISLLTGLIVLFVIIGGGSIFVSIFVKHCFHTDSHVFKCLAVLSLSAAACGGLLNIVYDQKAKVIEETLKKGIEINALIVDKDVYESNDVGHIDIMPFVIGSTIYSMPVSSPGSNSTSYSLRIYAEDKNYDITVPKQLYTRKQIGSKLKVKLYKEKIELLEDVK